MTQPDTQEKGLRFGCGFVFGLIVGALSFGLVFYGSGTAVVTVSVITAFIFGLASLRFGSAFWRWMKNICFWWV